VSVVNPLAAAVLASLLCFPAAGGNAQDPRILDLVSAASPERIEADIRALVGFGTRHTLSETESDTRGIGAARRWIAAELERISTTCGGCLEVITLAETFSDERRVPDGTEIVNVLAVQRGSEPGRFVLMSGDIDSRVSDVMDGASDSPGANDNASGIAGVLEAARLLGPHRFRATIVYAALSGEEQGLLGGRTVARHAREQGWQLEAVLNNDMIGNIEGVDGIVDNSTVRVFSDATPPTETEEERRARRRTGGEVDGISRQLARYVDRIADLYFPTLDVMMVYRLDRFGRGGHHTPFADVGFPAVRIMETHENYTRQHQDLRVEDGIAYGDTIDGVDFDYAAKVTALNVATLASLAWAPGPPTEVEISGAVQPAARLDWQPPATGGVTGYRVYWRLTDSPTWDHSRFVGDVTGHTLEGLVIDNYYFGVASVGPDGGESVVVFPRPRSRAPRPRG